MATAAVPSSTGLAKLYSERRLALVAYAHHQGATFETAEELVQDAFARFQNYSDHKAIDNQMAFLRRVIVNLVRDQYRQKVSTPTFVDYEEVATELLEEVSPEIMVNNRQQVAQSIASLQQLPKLTRQVFVDHRIHGLSYGAIAANHDLSIAKVRRHLSEAISTIQTQTGSKVLST